MITCSGLSKHFGNIHAIDDFTIDIPTGQVFGLLGPNGAGKTTTMRMLCCLIRPTKGTASIDGLDITKPADAHIIRGKIGFLPEVPGLYETLGAYQNLDFYAQFYNVPKTKREQAIKQTLDDLDLWNRRDEPVGGFSKGMKQKIAIARALIHNPQYLFLDEPTASLDPQASKLVRDYILDLKTKGTTILVNTHNLTEAERICDQVALIKNTLITVGNPKTLEHTIFTRTTAVTVDHLPPDLPQTITTLPGITLQKTQNTTLYLTVTNPTIDNPRIITWLKNQNVNVIYLTEEEHTLEDVYLKLLSTPHLGGSA
jgi:ABC-2 type transport system ATP-binding protein